jgi:hypothetical protein
LAFNSSSLFLASNSSRISLSNSSYSANDSYLASLDIAFELFQIITSTAMFETAPIAASLGGALLLALDDLASSSSAAAAPALILAISKFPTVYNSL